MSRVDINDPRSAQERGWGSAPVGYDHIVTITAAGISLAVHHAIAPIVEYLLKETHRRGYRFNAHQDDWGYAPRHIGNDPSRPWSNHAWGLAVDLNALTNPQASPRVTDMPVWMRTLWKSWGFRWGGNYQSSSPDTMHYEFMGTPEDAHRLRRKIKNAGKPKVYVAPKFPGVLAARYDRRQRAWVVGSTGRDVRRVQRALKIVPDGKAGEQFRHAVMQFQRSHGFKPTGALGRRGWEILFGRQHKRR